MKFLGFIVALFPIGALAQAVATATPAVNGAASALNSANSSVLVHVGAIGVGLGIVAELVVRLWPTKKPYSLFLYLGSALTALAALSTTLAGILNNVKPPTSGS